MKEHTKIDLVSDQTTNQIIKSTIDTPSQGKQPISKKSLKFAKEQKEKKTEKNSTLQENFDIMKKTFLQKKEEVLPEFHDVLEGDENIVYPLMPNDPAAGMIEV